MPTRLANFHLQDLTTQGLIDLLVERVESNQKTLLFFVNTNFVVKCQHLVEKISKAPALLVNDGLGMDVGNKLVNGYRFQKNLNGTDFIPKLLGNTSPHRVVLIGSRYEDLIPTANFINVAFNHEVVGYFDGYDDIKKPNFIEKLNALNPSLILVGMGNPLQEEWMLAHYEKINADLIMGVGALFVFLAGNKKRAPFWLRRLHLEWLHRLAQEPRRLIKRYTIDIFKFLRLCFKSHN